jgi:hypothetical protein
MFNNVLIRKNHSSDISPASPKIGAARQRAKRMQRTPDHHRSPTTKRLRQRLLPEARSKHKANNNKAEERRASHRRCFKKITSKLLRQAWLKSRSKKALFVGPVASKKNPKATENMSRARCVLRHVCIVKLRLP